MTRKRQQLGFSLTETLMAVGTLAIGMSFIAGTFLTGMYLSVFSTERTIAAVAAEEAFAKMRIFGLDPDDAALKTTAFVDYNDLATVPAQEWMYPSTPESSAKQYSWTALCRRVTDGSDLVQCTVFVSRQTGGPQKFWKRGAGTANLDLEVASRPHPVRINVSRNSRTADNEILLLDAASSDSVDERAFVSNGSILVDDATGQMYRVMERSADDLGKVVLDRDWDGGDLTADSGWMWVVPPAATGGKNPGVAVYQQTIRFARP